MQIRSKLSALFPPFTTVTDRQILLAAISAFGSIVLITVISDYFLSDEAPLLVASMGASAVLLFAVPASPMSQPWPLVGGHLVAVSVGISCARYLPDLPLQAAVAVAGAILGMYLLRCLHPPGGAAALTAVVGGQRIHDLGYQFLLAPVGLNVLIMLVLVLLLRQLAPVRPFSPVTVLNTEQDDAWQQAAQLWFDDAAVPFSPADLHVALQDLNTYLDVSTEDLVRLYGLAVSHARMRSLGDRRARDVMSTDSFYVEFATPLKAVWDGFVRHGVRGAPVLSPARHIIGVITIADFIAHASELEHGSVDEGLRQLKRPTPGFESTKPEVAGQIMSTTVITTQPDEPLARLVPVFTGQGIHHLPVVDENNKLLGMLSRNDLIVAAREEAASAAQPEPGTVQKR